MLFCVVIFEKDGNCHKPVKLVCCRSAVEYSRKAGNRKPVVLW